MNETIFTENFAEKQLHVSRIFNGPLDLVWRAWTEPELLDKWWAPKPYKSKTKEMNFSEGGHRHYCMEGPNGEQHWAIMKFIKIVFQQSFDADDAFCDKDGNINTDLPSTQWHVQFTATGSATKVDATTTFTSEEAMKQLINMGVKEGTEMTHSNLDALLKELSANE